MVIYNDKGLKGVLEYSEQTELLVDNFVKILSKNNLFYFESCWEHHVGCIYHKMLYKF